MTFKPSIAFRAKAKAGEAMVEAFSKKFGNRLGVSLHTHQGPPFMAWAKIGSERKETLVLIHGFGDRKESFYFISKFLNEKLNLVIPDLPGFGHSGRDPDLVYSLDNYIDWLGRFTEENGLDSFHLAGCSMGGTMILFYLGRPHRLLMNYFPVHGFISLKNMATFLIWKAPINWPGTC